ncbi:unnamed protein product [Ascophyllum nodosum]
MTGPDCAVMCELVNIHTHTHTARTFTQYINTYTIDTHKYIHIHDCITQTHTRLRYTYTKIRNTLRIYARLYRRLYRFPQRKKYGFFLSLICSTLPRRSICTSTYLVGFPPLKNAHPAHNKP